MKVWGVVCDNASNNAAMMKQLEKSKLKHLSGPLARVHCALHIMNLVATVSAVVPSKIILCNSELNLPGHHATFPRETPATCFARRLGE